MSNDDYDEDAALQLAIQMSLEVEESGKEKELRKEEEPEESYEVDMFLMENISSLISESSLLYYYEDVLHDIMDLAFDLLKVYVINFEKSLTLATSRIVTPTDIFKFLKVYNDMEDHKGRMFVPSRWFQNVAGPLKPTFSDNHDMNTLAEISRDFPIWHYKLPKLSFVQNDPIDITFEKEPGSNDFPIREGTELNVGTTVVGKDKYGKWYHGQILSIVDGAELIRRRNSELPLDIIFRHRIDKLKTSLHIDVDQTYFFIHFIGFKSSWNEWMSSERVHKENEGLMTIAEASAYKWESTPKDWKWFDENRPVIQKRGRRRRVPM